MGRKCCVTNCRTGYDAGKKAAVFRLPKDPSERSRWIQAIPRDNIPDKSDTVVCENHWPDGYEKVYCRGKFRPKSPPCVFDCVAKRLRPTQSPKPRSTCKASSSQRNPDIDQLGEFTKKDKIIVPADANDLVGLFNKHSFDVPVISFYSEGNAIIQSVALVCGVPLFMIKISRTLNFECFHCGIKCKIPSLAHNKISTMDCWSKLEEAVKYLSIVEESHKSKILTQYRSSIAATYSVGKPIYSAETLAIAFEYFASSRCTYEKFRQDHQLPSVKTLTRITAKVRNTDEVSFLEQISMTLEPRQRSVILMIDEIYVKAALSYHGGTVFGVAQNNPENLARTVLAIMVKCMFGGPCFLLKMIPVHGLTAEFQYEQVSLIIAQLQNCNINVIAIICDGNKVNQTFFKKFDTITGKPWVTKETHIHLLYDYVHLLKCIRNNWLTEKSGEICFKDENQEDCVARWSDLRDLYKGEEKSLVKQSKLNYVSVYPKPIERQNVDACLRVFSDETIVALENHKAVQDCNNSSTVKFLQMFLKFWRIVNVRKAGADKRFRDPNRAVISSCEDSRLEYLEQLADKVMAMSSKGKVRVRQISQDTSSCFYHTCKGLVSITKLLLDSSHEFVMLGNFSTDPLEKAFGKLRQGSGGTYFINTQDVLEKHAIYKAKLVLRQNVPLSALEFCSKHYCAKCSFKLSLSDIDYFDILPEKESSISCEEMECIIYIAGYIVRKNLELDMNSTYIYYEKFGSYTQKLSRGGLQIPQDTVSQWSAFCYLMFSKVKSKVCWKSLSNIFKFISEYYGFGMEQQHCHTMSNILLNNWCKSVTPRQGKEPAQKVLKLS